MKKTSRTLRFLAVISLIGYTPFSVQADDYSLTLTANSSWVDAPWVKQGGGTGIPGANDAITDLITGGSVHNLYLEGDQSVASLTRAGATGGTIRIYNGAQGSTINALLKVSGDFALQQGSMELRNYGTGRLSVEVGNLLIGKDGSTSAARLNIGTTGASPLYDNFSLVVTGTTTITSGNSAITLGESLSELTEVNLGHLYFSNTLAASGSPGITFSKGILTVRSLESASEGSTGKISGAGTLLIDGTGAGATSTNNVFGALIGGNLQLVKTGANQQILTGVNTYSGGTVVKGGVLSVRNTSGSALGRGSVEIENGGILAGNGQISLSANEVITVRAGGGIAPGADDLGFNRLTLSNYNNTTTNNPEGEMTALQMEESSAFTFRVNEHGESDQIDFIYYRNGALKLDGGQIAVNVVGTLSDNQAYHIFNFYMGGKSGSKASSGLVDGLVMGTGFEGYTATFHYDSSEFGGIGAIVMTVEAIPEPSTAFLFGVPLFLYGYAKTRGKMIK